MFHLDWVLRTDGQIYSIDYAAAAAVTVSQMTFGRAGNQTLNQAREAALPPIHLLKGFVLLEALKSAGQNASFPALVEHKQRDGDVGEKNSLHYQHV